MLLICLVLTPGVQADVPMAIQELEQYLHVEPELGAERARALLASPEADDDELLLAEAHRLLAVFLNVLGRNVEAQTHIGQALDLFAALGRDDRTALSLRHRGVILFTQGLYAEAVDSYMDSLRGFETLERPLEAAMTLSNLGNLYWSTGEPERAIAIHRRAMEAFEAHEHAMGIAGTGVNLGAALMRMVRNPAFADRSERNDWLEEARRAYQRSLEIFRQMGNPRGEFRLLSNLAGIELDLGNPEAALALSEQALDVAERIDEPMEKAQLHWRYIEILAALGRHDEEMEHLERVLAATEEVEFEHRREVWLRRLADLNAARGQYEQALRLERRAYEFESEQVRAEAAVHISEAMARYENERLERENLELRRDRELAELRASRQRLVLNSALVVACFALISLFTLISRMRLREKARAELDHAARHDPLTNTLNRRGLRDHISPADDLKAGLILLDIDDFKQINDYHGHDAGDEALVVTVERLRAQLADDELLCRWGGEEFLVISPDGRADTLAERLVVAVANQPVNFGQKAQTITISAGAAHKHPGEAFARAVQRADRALMEAKRAGKNRAVAMTMA